MAASSSVDVVSKTGQYWVVNTSPSVADTQYTIVEGTQAEAESLPNGGGISGPYTKLAQAYSVWKSEPDNKNVSTLQEIEAAIGAGVENIGSPDNPAGDANAAKAAQTTWALGVTGIADWFFRGLMVAGGIFLMGLGVSKMLNVENKITEIATKIPVVPV